ncbi:MAG TPA: fatty acid desaturase [Rhodocyclaceae bacterium]|uniref:DesA family fatty acid desaturase n=1 Tax=Zoogloea sp. TaxID=49181 RepID=UPI002B69D0F7|nr:fatty acid desaturase [Zoogloea sp.]HMV19029.1 fatty acid desaturase [Rhodocyclaceae bacterium]HMV64656.1 fatty acid desaturase [Rhodocyclaceae bacterium]HMY50927.1 fatty acid desaturase [Rhodocyclaceae bacterium]HNB65872.1 fatty acid desaturase [Rhodocyclaceae bacterium]HNC81022.1 fatty acid desaturase [Rhodocyclaceae bacterium]
MSSGLIDLPWWGYIVVTLALTHVTIASVTIFLHRHQAHRALELHPLPALFFRTWLWLTTGMVTKEWAAIHRKHHAKCETPEDPHSPQIVGINKVLWTGVFLYVKEARNKDTLQRYGHGTPDDWFERHIFSAAPKLGIVITLIVDSIVFGVWPGVLIWGVQMVWIPFWAAGVINGLGHFWGYRNYNCADASTNLIPWGILIGGEELHNNHHSFATSAKLSARWYEFDIGWVYIRSLEILGLARVKKVIPTPRFGVAKARADFDMLQAVITHRYDVMTRYVQSLGQIAKDEFEALKAQSGGKLNIKDVRRWLTADEAQLGADERQRLATLLKDNARLQTVVAMRQELTALWARSTATREQLLQQLQDWIARAEGSGIRQLEDFSLRLRRYAA